jgi:excisionase family DNA binding protein
MDELLTIEEVAAILKVSAYSVRRYLKAKKLRGVKVGGQWRVHKSALQKFVQTNIED